MFVKCPNCKGKGFFRVKTGVFKRKNQNKERMGSKPKQVEMTLKVKCEICGGARKIDWIKRITYQKEFNNG